MPRARGRARRGPHAALVGDELRAKAKQAARWYLRIRWLFAQRFEEGDARALHLRRLPLAKRSSEFRFIYP
jgi:hypothetical protein